jgi:hypothetical protein
MLTVETGVNALNGNSKSTNERGPSLVGSLGSSCRYKRLGCSVSPVQIIYFLTVHYFDLCVPIPIAQQPGHAVVQGRLSLNVFLRS